MRVLSIKKCESTHTFSSGRWALAGHGRQFAFHLHSALVASPSRFASYSSGGSTRWVVVPVAFRALGVVSAGGLVRACAACAGVAHLRALAPLPRVRALAAGAIPGTQSNPQSPTKSQFASLKGIQLERSPSHRQSFSVAIAVKAGAARTGCARKGLAMCWLQPTCLTTGRTARHRSWTGFPPKPHAASPSTSPSVQS